MYCFFCVTLSKLQIKDCKDSQLNPCHATVPFLYPLKTLEKLTSGFLMFSEGIERTMAWNCLTKSRLCNKVCQENVSTFYFQGTSLTVSVNIYKLKKTTSKKQNLEHTELVFKGRVMQVERTLINDVLCVLKHPVNFAFGFLLSFLFINKTLRLHNLKTRTVMNAKISVFLVCVEAIINFFVYHLHNCIFNLITSSVQKMVTNTSKILPQVIQKCV